MDNSEKIQKTLESLEGIKRAPANPFLFEKIKNRLSEKHEPHSADKRLVFAIVTAIIAAIILNVSVWQNYLTSKNNFSITQNSNQDISSFAEEYFDLNSTYSY